MDQPGEGLEAMHAHRKSNATPRSWKESISPDKAWIAAAAIGALALVVAVLSVPQPVVAQAPAPPAVRVQRDYQLGQQVWPVDLNRDGITDLVSSSSGSGRVQVSLGRGDGTFDAPVESTFQGVAVGVGDFNGDHQPDVVASQTTAEGTVFVLLPGTGTATLGSAVTIVPATPIEFPPFALSADFDGDGARDLVLPSPTGVRVYPGQGDLTFGTPIELVTDGAPLDGIVADIDNDGRTDLVTANGEEGTVSIFLNQGAFVFSPSDVHLAHQVNDVTVADLDHDGRLDLLIAAGRTNSDSGFGEGFVLVLRGNGDGTFGHE